MTQAKRPFVVTVIAILNLLLGLILLAVAIGNGVMIYPLIDKAPSADRSVPDAAVDGPGDAPKQPKLGGPPGLPRPPAGPAPTAQRPIDPKDVLAIRKEQQKYLMMQEPRYELLSILGFIVHTTLALMLVAVGIGLLLTRPAGRTLVFFLFLYSTPVALGTAYYAYEFLRPELERWERNRAAVFTSLGETPPDPIIRTQSIAFVGVCVAGGVIFPFIQVLAMMLPSTRAAFRRPMPTMAPMVDGSPPSA